MDNPVFFIILFHALYRERDRDRDKHPSLFISVREFEACVKTLLDSNFTFIEPADLIIGNINDNQILLTFDDGYYNNFYALDILEKYSIKAIFFYVKHQIANQKLFWWDVYYAHRIKDAPSPIIHKEIRELLKLERVEIEEKIKDRFGADCFEVKDNLCRPMTVEELKTFVSHPLVEIGVHSASHEVLTNCSIERIREEVGSCKEFLEDISGKEIPFLSYPNGNFNKEIISIIKELGFQFGITTIPGFNECSKLKNDTSNFKLRRNMFPAPGDPESVVRQIENFIRHSYSRV